MHVWRKWSIDDARRNTSSVPLAFLLAVSVAMLLPIKSGWLFAPTRRFYIAFRSGSEVRRIHIL